MGANHHGVIVNFANIEQRLVDIRRHLHQNPELSNEEYETTAFIREQLEQAGIRVSSDYALPTGLIAEVGDPEHASGPIIALRADIDALPIHEQTGLPYASKIPGKMHACGHDFHTAAILGAAFLLKEREHELKGTVRFVFQPAEEKAVGAVKVLQAGALEGVRAIYGFHNKPELPTGTIGIKAGALMAAADGFVIELEGVASHAAVPDASIDPIVTAAHLVTALQSIVSRNINPLDSAVISVTKINSGTSWNVIPEKAVLDGTLRTFDEEVRSRVIERFEQIVNGVAAAFRTKATLRWIQGPPSVTNDAYLAVAAEKTAKRLGLTVVEPKPSPAGEDFAFYQKEVPGFFAFIGTSGEREWHHPAFDVDEQALPLSASFFAELAATELERFAASQE
ncbi:amidohydrolase [Brevibacillus sp. SIMBA_040]|uniref:amidohydrolase n=1 Tax=unclassified Brevibacillus TaxID=2684853 RepID=UPI0039784E79